MRHKIGKDKNCITGKTRYRDRKSATYVMRSMHNEPSRTTTPQRVYECQHCDGWHLTSQDRRP